MNDWMIEELTDPNNFQGPLILNKADGPSLLQALRMMLLIRLTERFLANGKMEGTIGGPVHLGVGQEAVAVGVAAGLKKSDRVFGAHRSHSHVLSLGADVQGLFAEVLGKDTGLSRGMGGSMHLWDQQNGFCGSVPIVAGTVPLAVGAGLAARLQNTNDVSVAYLGDGAVEEGVVHESLNLARMLKAPVLFVVENNLYASHMHISQRQPKVATARFAAANDIEYSIVDGNDVVAVRKSAGRLIDRARAGEGPGFLEAITYRWYGHVDWREDIDVGVDRSADNVAVWRKRDPIARLVSGMISAQICSAEDVANMELLVEREVAEAWTAALGAPYPKKAELLKRVYSVAGEE